MIKNFLTILLITITVLSTQISCAFDLPVIDSLSKEFADSTTQDQKLDWLLIQSEQQIFKQPQKTLEYAREALMLSYILKREQSAMDASCLLGKAYLNLDSLRQALKHSEIALSKARNLRSGINEAKAMRQLGKVFIELSDYNAAADLLFKSLHQFEKINQTDELSETNLTIGYMYYLLGSYNKSLGYYQTALRFAMRTQDQTDIALALNNIASVYTTKGDDQKALRYYLKSLEINKKLDNRKLLGQNYQNLGEISLETGNYSQARDYITHAVALFDSLNNKKEMLSGLLSLAAFYQSIGQADSMKLISNQVFSVADSSLLVIKANACRLIFDYYQQKNLSDSANKYGLIYYNFENLINLDKHNADVENMELRYTYQVQKQAFELEAKQKLFARIVVILVLILILILITLAYYRLNIRNRSTIQENINLDRELEQKNKELMTSVMMSLQRNDVLNEVKTEIKSIKVIAVKPETKSALDQVSRRIDEITHTNVWSEFEHRFKNVHLDFYKNLAKEFPDLTSNEKRMCAFLKLDMSTKEISLLTGQTVPAIEKARNRLRKKLGIANSTISLAAFMAKY